MVPNKAGGGGGGGMPAFFGGDSRNPKPFYG